jgi:hypothetical protein
VSFELALALALIYIASKIVCRTFLEALSGLSAVAQPTRNRHKTPNKIIVLMLSPFFVKNDG